MCSGRATDHSNTRSSAVSASLRLTIPIQKQLARIGLGPRRVVEATEEVVTT